MKTLNNLNKSKMSKTDNIVERRYLTTPVKVEKRAEDETELSVVEGYAALYNKRADIGWFDEEILPGAFDDVLNDDVRCLKNHDPNYILARSVNGKGTLELFLDEKGLGYRYTTPDISYAKDLQRSIELGDVSQSSFSFKAKEVVWIEKEGENELRQIKKIETLYDVSPVTFPAYQDTTVGKRSWEAHLEEKKKETETRNEDAGDSSKIMDEYEARHKFNQNKYKQ